LESQGVARPDVGFQHFTRERFKSWAAWMRDDRGHAPKTVGLRLTALKAFCAYAAAEDITLGAVLEDARSVKPPKNPRKPVEYLPPAATAAILAACDGRTSKSRRNRMMLIFLYDTAARVSEAAGVKVRDLRLDGAPFVSLLGKGRKPRNTPLMGKTVEHLRVYLDEFHPGAGQDRPLFYSLKNGRPGNLSSDTIQAVLKQAADTARATCPEVPDRVHPHLVRKTRAMDLYQRGVPLALIMQMLGHESMATTSAFYAFATQQMMADAIEAATPLSLDQPEQWKEQAVIDALYRL
ncbi:MAG: tyrosine-type recombinase/integrase, partial [Bifidobacteriaceae bacterium]|nr:tyrosine-type recombinase/integrase [Bifidobacteriaceae bacterium]